jgi:hypothetical protein
MKAHYAALLVMLVGFAVILGQKAIPAKGAGNEGIPIPSGHFSLTDQGFLAICENPITGAFESCNTSNAVVVSFNGMDNVAGTLDSNGKQCLTGTGTVAGLPLGVSPPFVMAKESMVVKLLDYDSTTGTGDSSFTVYYPGGKCHGATFDSTGATEVTGATFHFVVTDGGNRVDWVLTTTTYPVGVFGGFYFTGTYLRQTKSDS